MLEEIIVLDIVRGMVAETYSIWFSQLITLVKPLVVGHQRPLKKA